MPPKVLPDAALIGSGRLLYACSSNPGKLREFTAQLPITSGFDIRPLPRLSELLPPEEDGATYEENAALKAVYYSRYTDELVFADDSGLEVNALDGAPGIHSARFAGPQATSAQNNAMLLAKLNDVADRRARFVTAISLARAGRQLHTTVGAAEGEILVEPRGALGFGYDALFLFPPLGKTFAELEDGEKFAVSARGHAFRNLLDWIATRHL
jgi:XTP/dITP diphosphohydrolase